MNLSFEDLQNFAALNPYRWDELTQDELDALVLRSGLELICRPLAGDPRRDGTGKTIITNAVLARIGEEDPELLGELEDIRYSAYRSNRSVFQQDQWEREVFECLEGHLERLMSFKRMETLAGIAQATRARKLPSDPAPHRRAT